MKKVCLTGLIVVIGNLIVGYLVMITPISAIATDYYTSWRSNAITQTGVTCTLTTATNRRPKELIINNSGSVDVFMDIGGTLVTCPTTTASARLAAGDTVSFGGIEGVKTIGFKTNSGTGTIEVHTILYQW
jgi:hypothetical protein